MAQNPAWGPDELILALDLYFRVPATRQNKRHPELLRLSSALRALPLHPDPGDPDRFRNVQGCFMKLQNFKAVDPTYEGKGLERGAGPKEDRVFKRFAHRQPELAELASLIRASAGSTAPAITMETDGEGVGGMAEGRIVYRIHRAYERNAAAGRKKKNEMRESLGRLACEVCGVAESALQARFGLPSGDLFECHHRVPLHALGTVRATRPKDLAVLCPTCHRAIHRIDPLPNVEELRQRVVGPAHVGQTSP